MFSGHIQSADHGRVLRVAAGHKLLFAGHKVTLVCLPAEVEAINSEGIRVRLPVKGRSAPVEIDSRKLPGKAVRRRPGRRQPGRLRSRRAGDAGAAIPLAGRARTARRGGEVAGALHVDHEHAAAALSEAHPRPRTPTRCTTASPTPPSGRISIPAAMTLCSPDPQAFRPPDEKINVLQVTLPTNFKAARFDSDESHRHPAPDAGGDRGDPLRRRRCDDRPAGEAQGARVRCSCRWRSGRCCCTGNYRCVQKDAAR